MIEPGDNGGDGEWFENEEVNEMLIKFGFISQLGLLKDELRLL